MPPTWLMASGLTDWSVEDVLSALGAVGDEEEVELGAALRRAQFDEVARQEGSEEVRLASAADFGSMEFTRLDAFREDQLRIARGDSAAVGVVTQGVFASSLADEVHADVGCILGPAFPG